MIHSVKRFLSKYGLTVSEVAKRSGQNRSTLTKTFDRPILDWKLSAFKALAVAANTKTDYVVRELQLGNWSLSIDNNQQSIQGFRIANKKVFKRVKKVVEAECSLGWKPTHNDIKSLVNNDYDPNYLARSIIKDFQLKEHLIKQANKHHKK